MVRHIVVVVFMLFSSQAMAANGLDLSAGLGYRSATFDWNIAGDINGQNPNILSELEWSDMQIAELKLGARLVLGGVYLRADGAYGEIVDGENQDSDYSSDNRTGEFSRSNNEGGGALLDTSAGLGYRFEIYDRGTGHYAHLTPLLGYSYHEQNLALTKGVQTIPASGPFNGLNSSYDTQWEGPWVGIDIWLEAGKNIAVTSSYEYHQADYYAVGNWNLRTDLQHPVSFSHRAQASGRIVTLGLAYTLSPSTTLNLDLEHQDWTTDAGVDTTFPTVGPPIQTQFNKANWESYSFTIELSRHI